MLIIDQLIQGINNKSCPVVVGLDPLIGSIPAPIKTQMLNEYGNTNKAVAEAFIQFNSALIAGLKDLIPAVKLQMACYELYGADGINAFYQTVQTAQEAGLIVIDDSKRNDIGSTAKLYAMGHLGNPPLIEGVDQKTQPDFLTVNPFLGADTFSPFWEICKENNKGVFVLVRTSNPSAADYQEAQIGGMPLFKKIALDMEQAAQGLQGDNGYAAVGAVVGATWSEEAEELRTLMPSVYFLVPGYGAQGATADDVMATFDQRGYGALINSSRGIIFAAQSQKYQSLYPNPEDFVGASRQATIDMRDDLLQALSKSGKLPKNW